MLIIYYQYGERDREKKRDIPDLSGRQRHCSGECALRGEDVWLTVEQIMELFDASQLDVSYHIKQIYAEGEQDPEQTYKNLLVRQEGNRSVRRNTSKRIVWKDVEYAY